MARDGGAEVAWQTLWGLAPGISFLNHGSFGACPRHVLAYQTRLREELEAEPVRFLYRELPGRLEAARAALGAFLHADPDDLAFVPNATTGVNTVLRSLVLSPGDEVVTTDHAYQACRNALDAVAEGRGATVRVASIPLPLEGPDQVVESVLGAVTPRTRLALLDHVTSPTGLVLPIQRLVDELAARGIDTLVDGAHAPGMLPVDLRGLGAAYYTGNAHKWLCAPKGAAFLFVRRDRQSGVRPLVISHGASSPRTDRSRFRLEFDWTGTGDPTPFLAIPEAIRYLGTIFPGGWPGLMARNRWVAVEARATLNRALGSPPLAPDSMLGSLASVRLPAAPAPAGPDWRDPLQMALYERQAIEVLVYAWPALDARFLRVSAQLYNTPGEYARLAEVLPGFLAEEAEGRRGGRETHRATA